MRKFEEYMEVVFRHEGGYANDPADPGGETKYGISFRFIRAKGIDINADGRVDGQDIRGLTRQQATKLYYTYFYKPLNLHLLRDENLRLHVFDMAVNAGPKTAVRLLQRILRVTDDGELGRITALSANNRPGILEQYIKSRINYYESLPRRNPRLQKFVHGWIRRVETTKFK